MTLRLFAADLAVAADLLRQGEIVAMPTETVYGLAGDAGNDRAVAKIFAAKERPHFNPLIVHVASVADARSLVRFDERAATLARSFWPGPLSLVLPRLPEARVSLLASAGLDTLAVRLPAHPLAQALIRAAGVPLAAPSANRSGAVSPTTADHVAQELDGRIAAILDGGPCRVGVESTVLDCTGPLRLLRPGGIPLEALVAIAGPIETATQPTDAPLSPGMLQSHYAPRLPLRLDAHDARPGEALLAFGARAPAGAALSLSPAGDLVEAAANLFAMLRALDRPDGSGIAVMPIPEAGLGRAINDRLRRAAAPRDRLASRTPPG
jgi:L-threonylcarbamoyladenylate synthase